MQHLTQHMAKLATSAALLISLSACEQTDQLPVGSTAEIFPTQVQWNIATRSACDLDNGPFNDQRISVSLKDAEGQPLYNAPLALSLDLSESTSNGAAVLALFDDSNGDGVFDANEQVTTEQQSAYNTHTDNRSGAKQVMVRVNLSCPYKGNLYAFAGNAGVLMTINVVADSDETSDTETETETETDTETDVASGVTGEDTTATATDDSTDASDVTDTDEASATDTDSTGSTDNTSDEDDTESDEESNEDTSSNETLDSDDDTDESAS